MAELTHDEWTAAATEEYRRLDELLAALDESDWTSPTECTGWAVRDLVAHLAGAAEATSRLREAARQARAGRRLLPDGMVVDGMNAVQVGERAGVAPPQLRRSLADAARRGVRARARIPAALRRLPVPFGPPLGVRPLGYLTDRIYTRDAWMHRIDICRATGRALLLTPDHDGRLVDDVVTEWAGRHGSSYLLELTGPAGGRWRRGVGGDAVTLDAVDFVRVLSGRGEPSHPLLGHVVPF